ncbi:acyl-CoA dehydrogenase family protein [Arthrobacter sp. Cr_A7]|uniref:acyl-CoA dehydrogenase family protein n=1 Tax=Arthrobacter sp. Cr_A7 TaxID=3031017 RepID=UPI0023D99C13|nr:acyl-CoA dehydrogenase family protein [Arthrobacter sp. Cr_A7]MDF2050418.1 acyl-CoA dehydrogenase family protein [Arthrobacter sp. Cr_A7]
MTEMLQSTGETGGELQALTQRLRELIPVIREYSGEAEHIRRIPQPVIDRASELGIFDALVPRRWGGQELGLAAFYTSARELAHGDMSAAWVVSLLMSWNTMACRMPLEAQEQLYADRNYITAALAYFPPGKAERADGGYTVSGKWGYGSGLPNADWAFLSGMFDTDNGPDMLAFLVPKSDLILHDDWKFAGLSSTGSVSFSAEDVFVPEQFAISFGALMSPFDHPGATLHADPTHRFLGGPTVSNPWGAGIALGGAERMVELARERLFNSQIMGISRIDQPLSRVRWAQAHQLVRAAELLYDKLVAETVAHGEGYWRREDTGQQTMDTLTIVALCKDAARLIMDGAGSSAWSTGNELQRYFRDMHVLANHLQHDWDNGAERASRHLLGLPYAPTDPFNTEGPEAAHA